MPPDPMPKAVKVKEGAEYLPEHDSADLERMRDMLPTGKPHLRVQAAILRKKDMSVEKIGAALGERPSIIHNWLMVASPPAPGSCHVAVTVSFLTNSDAPAYFRPAPMVIRSSDVRGSLPCLSQQLWQSGQ